MKFYVDIFPTNLLNHINNNQCICTTKELWDLRANNNNNNCHRTYGYLFSVKYSRKVFTLSTIRSFCL